MLVFFTETKPLRCWKVPVEAHDLRAELGRIRWASIDSGLIAAILFRGEVHGREAPGSR